VEVKDKTEKEYEQLLFDVKYDKEQLEDAFAQGLLLHRLVEERKKTNSLFQEISSKLTEIIDQFKGMPKKEMKIMSDIDEKIIAHIQRVGKVDAEEIQNVFGYKGKNAASARMNALYQKGLLRKGRAGKKVFFWAR